MSRVSLALLLVALTTACSEAASDDEGSTSGGGGSSGEGGSADASTSASGPASSGAGGDLGGLAINEISADGDDWIELFNRGSTTVDLGGLRLADSEEPSVPKIDEAITFPEGTELAAGGYLFILADVGEPVEGPQDACDPGPAPCFHAPWGLSKDGDEVFLLGEGDAVLLSIVYPAGGAPEGSSFGRLPDGTGDFTVTAATPGAANAAP